jgi:prophage tail gpP-like protein
MSDEIVAVKINGKKFTGWESVSINKSMDNVCGSFDIGLISSTTTKGILPGQKVVIEIDDEPIINGYIDKRARKIDENSKSMTISGRDRTGDLVDCSAIKSSGSWKSIGLLQLCTDVCKPFGIKCFAGSGADLGKPFKSVTIQDGETAFALIERLCRQRSLIPLANSSGDLVLEVPSTTPADDSLSAGFNIKTISEEIDYANRFSSYTVKAQNSGGGNPWLKSTSTGIKGAAKDAVITRYRPLIIQAETKHDNGTAKDRAAWEAVVRFGRSLNLTVDVKGWKQSSGVLWKRNTLIDILHEELEIDGTFIAIGVNYKLDDNSGKTSTLTLRNKLALTPNKAGEIEVS